MIGFLDLVPFSLFPSTKLHGVSPQKTQKTQTFIVHTVTASNPTLRKLHEYAVCFEQES